MDLCKWQFSKDLRNKIKNKFFFKFFLWIKIIFAEKDETKNEFLTQGI